MKVIHFLNWKLETIEKELENIKKQGFDAIQINPMQKFKEEKEFKWWSSYQPLNFKIGNMFGSKEDLKRLCQRAKEYDIDVIVDVVLNHTANKSGKEPLIPHESVDERLLKEKIFWKQQIMMTDGNNRWDATKHLIGLPGLDLSNIHLQNIIFEYLKELKQCGVKGLRFDAAKHIGLPNDGVDFFKNVRTFMLLNDMYGYGEFLGGNKEWRDEMAELLMVLAPEGTTIEDVDKLVAFVESHDTYQNIASENNDYDNTRYMNTNDLIESYLKIRELYKNTIVYVRPLDENNPYCKNTKGLTCEDVYKLDEGYFFNRVYLEDKQIKEINEVKALTLSFK